MKLDTNPGRVDIKTSFVVEILRLSFVSYVQSVSHIHTVLEVYEPQQIKGGILLRTFTHIIRVKISVLWLWVSPHRRTSSNSCNQHLNLNLGSIRLGVPDTCRTQSHPMRSPVGPHEKGKSRPSRGNVVRTTRSTPDVRDTRVDRIVKSRMEEVFRR